MKRRRHSWLTLVSAGCLAGLVACGGGPVADTARCPVGDHTVARPASGYCFVHPDGYSVRELTDGGVLVYAGLPGEVGEPSQPFLSLAVEPAQAESSEAQADLFARGYAGFDLARQSIKLAGQPAVVFRHVPGQDLARVILVVQGNLSYRLWFVPDDETNGAPGAEMEALFETVTGSFAFISG